MTLIIDAAPLVALADSSEPQRESILSILSDEDGELVIPAPITAEVDYLLGRRFGGTARRAFLTDLATERFSVANLESEDFRMVLDLETRYESLNLGLADSSLVVAADRCATNRILSFDERDLRAVKPLDGKAAFTILPADY